MRLKERKVLLLAVFDCRCCGWETLFPQKDVQTDPKVSSLRERGRVVRSPRLSARRECDYPAHLQTSSVQISAFSSSVAVRKRCRRPPLWRKLPLPFAVQITASVLKMNKRTQAVSGAYYKHTPADVTQLYVPESSQHTSRSYLTPKSNAHQNKPETESLSRQTLNFDVTDSLGSLKFSLTFIEVWCSLKSCRPCKVVAKVFGAVSKRLVFIMNERRLYVVAKGLKFSLKS